MDSCERFNETSLPDKKIFYSELYLKDITDKDYTHAQKVFKVFNLKMSVTTMTCMFKAIHYCLLMYSKTLEACVLRYMNLILLIFCQLQD